MKRNFEEAGVLKIGQREVLRGKENSDNVIMEYYFTDDRVNIDQDITRE